MAQVGLSEIPSKPGFLHNRGPINRCPNVAPTQASKRSNPPTHCRRWMGVAHTAHTYGGVNVSAAPCLQALSISVGFGPDNSIRIPLLELGATSALCVSVAIALGLIVRWPRRHTKLVGDSWEPITASDIAVRCFTVIASIDLVVALLTVVLLLVPFMHDRLRCIAYAGTLTPHRCRQRSSVPLISSRSPLSPSSCKPLQPPSHRLLSPSRPCHS